MVQLVQNPINNLQLFPLSQPCSMPCSAGFQKDLGIFMGSECLSSAHMNCEWNSAELLGREGIKEQALEKHTEAAPALQPK